VGRESVDGFFIGFGRGRDSLRQRRRTLVPEIAAFPSPVIPTTVLTLAAESSFAPVATIPRWSPALPAITEILALPALPATAESTLIATASGTPLAIPAPVAAAFLGTGGRMIFPGRGGPLAELVHPGWHDLQSG
jgi:hypothetical protein